MKNMAKLENRVALIYGGTSGLGEATARLYAKEGAKVAIAGRSEERENKIVKDIQDNGGEAVFVKVDLMDSDQIKQSVQDTVDTFGTIDILYNGARILDKYEDIINTDEETLDSMIEFNLQAVITYSTVIKLILYLY